MHVEPNLIARTTKCLITMHHVSNTDPQNVFILAGSRASIRLALILLWLNGGGLFSQVDSNAVVGEMTSARRQHRHKATLPLHCLSEIGAIAANSAFFMIWFCSFTLSNLRWYYGPGYFNGLGVSWDFLLLCAVTCTIFSLPTYRLYHLMVDSKSQWPWD